MDEIIQNFKKNGFTSFNLQDLYPNLYKKLEFLESNLTKTNDFKNLRIDFSSKLNWEEILNNLLLIDDSIQILHFNENFYDKIFSFQCRIGFNKDSSQNEKNILNTINYLESISIKISQCWRESFTIHEDEKDLINEISNQVFNEFYKNNTSRKIDLENSHVQKTYYSKNCFLEKHLDGETPHRIFAILVYLNRNHDSNAGGNLIVENNQNTSIVNPEFGNVAIIDFIENDIYHEVEKVKEGGERFALLSFTTFKPETE